MKRKIWLMVLAWALVFSAHGARAEGDFFVIGGGGSVGTRITSLPYTISAPGFYYLGGDLSTGNSDCIIVQADDVTIDLMGFSLTGTGLGTGILIQGRTNVEIRNGTLSKFSYGIFEGGIPEEEIPPGVNHRVVNIRATGITTFAILLYGKGHRVENCNCSNNHSGIYVASGAITECIANSNTATGITLDGPGNVTGNVANENGVHGFSIGTNIFLYENIAFGNGQPPYATGLVGPSGYWDLNAPAAPIN
jgi:hypothetical protein